MALTVNDIIALSQAGFTKADILALTAVQPTDPAQPGAPVAQPSAPVAQPSAPVQPTAPVVQPTTPVAQPTAPVAQPTAPVAQPTDGVSMSNEQFTALLQTISAGNASIDLPPTYDINNVLADHYKTLMVGDSQK